MNYSCGDLLVKCSSSNAKPPRVRQMTANLRKNKLYCLFFKKTCFAEVKRHLNDSQMSFRYHNLVAFLFLFGFNAKEKSKTNFG